MSLKLLRTTSENPDFVALVAELDLYLAKVDGKDHDFYHQYNHIDDQYHVVLGYKDGLPVGCGAIKKLNSISTEIKRMYVRETSRQQGVAGEVLAELERWADELGFESCVLETGKRQVEAIQLYKKNGYQLTANYGQYVGIDSSLCFQKVLT